MSESNGFLRRENAWLVIPLAALSIPILAIMRDTSWIGWVFGGVVLIIALTIASRSLLKYRHELRMNEIEARERIVRAEHDQLASVERILELDDVQERLRRKEPPSPA